jgi:hypothetical protein
MDKSEALALLYQAAASPLGIVVPSSNLTILRARLYAARKDAADPSLDVLELRQGPDDPSELWITHKGATIRASES